MNASQVRAAHRNKALINVEPKSVEDISFGKKEYPSFIVPLGQLTGVLPVYESGSGIFDEENFDKLNDNEKNQVRRRMYKALVASDIFKVEVLEIDENIALLSRKKALEARAEKSLKDLGVKDITELKDKVLTATVIIAEAEQAICDLDGFTGILHRSEIDYTNPLAFRVLKTGDTFSSKVLDINSDGTLSISRKALLPDPWDNVDFQPGAVVKAKVIGALKSGAGLTVAYEPGVIGFVRNFSPRNVPDRFENVAVKIDTVDKDKRQILGHLVS